MTKLGTSKSKGRIVKMVVAGALTAALGAGLTACSGGTGVEPDDYTAILKSCTPTGLEWGMTRADAEKAYPALADSGAGNRSGYGKGLGYVWRMDASFEHDALTEAVLTLIVSPDGVRPIKGVDGDDMTVELEQAKALYAEVSAACQAIEGGVFEDLGPGGKTFGDQWNFTLEAPKGSARGTLYDESVAVLGKKVILDFEPPESD